MTDIFILGGARTPMADYTGKLKDSRRSSSARSRRARRWSGPASTPDDDRPRRLRQRAADERRRGLRRAARRRSRRACPIEVPALTVNRLCGSGIQAAISGAQMIQLGEADIVLTGGMESMSQAPHVIRGLRSGLRLGQGQLEDSLWSALLDTHCGCTMAATAENCAAKYGISREEQDAYALRSQQLADEAWKAGRFDGGSRPGRDQVAQGRRALRAGRSHAPGHDDRGAGEAAGGVQQERLRHGRQRQRHRRRRRRAAARVRRRA